MANLTIDTGVVEYTLNDKYTVVFNPTDLGFTERLYKTFEDLDKRHEAYKDKVSKTAKTTEIFDLAREMNAHMRQELDILLGDGMCDAVFGDTNAYAFAGGCPLWANLLLAIMDEVDNAYAREQKAVNPRIEKYMKKYHK